DFNPRSGHQRKAQGGAEGATLGRSREQAPARETGGSRCAVAHFVGWATSLAVSLGLTALSLAKFAQFTSEQNALDQGLQNLPPPPESDPTWQAVSFAVEMA